MAKPAPSSIDLMTQQLGSLVERYFLEEPISSGGMAAVWKARDEILARPVAVKVLHPHLAGDPGFVRRFQGEAQAAARLIHPNIVATYDTGSEPGPNGELNHFIVAEYCGGGSLVEALARQGPFELDEAVSIASAISEALSCAHDNGVIHRDLRAANVLFTEQGVLKVADFGIAGAAYTKGDISTTSKVVPSVTHLAPEQIDGQEPNERSDIYALGSLLYQLLVGRPAFKEEPDLAAALALRRSDPPPLRSIKAGIPRALDGAVLKALERDPERRYASAAEMRSSINDAIGNGGATQVLRLGSGSAKDRYSPAPDESSPSSFFAAEGRRILPVIGLIVAAIVAALLVAQLGGPAEETGGGATPAPSEGAAGEAAVLEVQDATDFDPHADDRSEHPGEVPLAIDGDPSTAWSTSTYRNALPLIKEGVGLIFDLGEPLEVTQVDVLLGGAGYNFELRASNDIGATQDDFELIEEVAGSSDAGTTFELEGTEARYWLVWLTGFPGGAGGSGSIAEVGFRGN
jgi:serine/threonine protein kinase